MSIELLMIVFSGTSLLVIGLVLLYFMTKPERDHKKQ